MRRIGSSTMTPHQKKKVDAGNERKLESILEMESLVVREVDENKEITTRTPTLRQRVRAIRFLQVAWVVCAIGTLVGTYIASRQGGEQLSGHNDVKAQHTNPDLASEDDSSPPSALVIPNINSTLKKRQIRNYINGTALMINIHITHHAGTTFCSKMRMVGPTPEFACLGGSTWPSDQTTFLPIPWKYEDTAFMVHHLRPHFHMVSWEFQRWANLHRTTDWGYEDLLSVIVMRDPLDRFMAGGKCQREYMHLEDPTPETQQKWWEYANTICADNFALKVLAPDSRCCKGANTSSSYLESAKNLLRRFTFIVDQACLNESLKAMTSVLNISVDISEESRGHHIHKSARERLANETLYEYVRNKFQRDIELYEWAKSKSIVDCSKLKKN